MLVYAMDAMKSRVHTLWKWGGRYETEEFGFRVRRRGFERGPHWGELEGRLRRLSRNRRLLCCRYRWRRFARGRCRSTSAGDGGSSATGTCVCIGATGRRGSRRGLWLRLRVGSRVALANLLVVVVVLLLNQHSFGLRLLSHWGLELWQLARGVRVLRLEFENRLQICDRAILLA